MINTVERHLELISQTKQLRAFALSVQPDANASYLLMHRALIAAFQEKPGFDRPGGAGALLRDMIQRRLDREAVRV